MEITNKTEINEVEKLKERINQLEEKQKELEIKLDRLTDKFYSQMAFERDREDYLEILNDTHGYYDYE